MTNNFTIDEETGLTTYHVYFVHGAQFRVMVDFFDQKVTYYKYDKNTLIPLIELNGIAEIRKAAAALNLAADLIEGKKNV